MGFGKGFATAAAAEVAVVLVYGNVVKRENVKANESMERMVKRHRRWLGWGEGPAAAVAVACLWMEGWRTMNLVVGFIGK